MGEFPQIRVTLFGGLYNKQYCYSGYCIRVPYFQKLPCGFRALGSMFRFLKVRMFRSVALKLRV